MNYFYFEIVIKSEQSFQADREKEAQRAREEEARLRRERQENEERQVAERKKAEVEREKERKRNLIKRRLPKEPEVDDSRKMARLRFRIPAKKDPDAMDDDSGSSGNISTLFFFSNVFVTVITLDFICQMFWYFSDFISHSSLHFLN